MGNPVAQNSLRTRSDLERAAIQMIEPLIPHLTEGNVGLHLGETGATYPAAVAEMEGFARVLWAIVPMLAGKCESVRPIWKIWREGIVNGVDPSHPGYWGECSDYDQRLVEMAVMGMGMSVAPQEFFFDLPREAQKNLWAWLDQINHHDMPKNNWTFFRVLVNMGFMVCNLPYDAERMEKDFAMIEEHYDGDGWYFDYATQREYYTMWAFGYYELIYAYVMRERDPERSAEYIRRAQKMAVDFACWFDDRGEAVPYGRSLTYRFAEGSFYAALALVAGETPEMTYGMMKRLLLGNMRKWFSYPIFTRDGVLTIGYHYPNLVMAEGYNSPGSPYWSFKAFAALMLPEDHPFWQAEEEAPCCLLLSRQEHMRMLLARSDDGSHVMAFTAGNHANEHTHAESKYEKFVYSTVFGFSVCRSMKLLHEGAYDSMLAVSEDGVQYHPRYGCDEYEIGENSVRSVWKPLIGCRVETTIYPVGEWHVRVHHICNERPLFCAEGGYALARDGKGQLKICVGEGNVLAGAPWGVSGIRAVCGYDEAKAVMPEPNTNLMSPRTVLPTLMAKLPAGEHTLVSMVYGSLNPDENAFENPPAEVVAYGKMD